ncbi:MAG: hypothetical protein KGH72_04470 [Candidatus Micrarchaeota archaeon]|nr:hypothetical protein [Candidatus Micrarchaeota archaeon]
MQVEGDTMPVKRVAAIPELPKIEAQIAETHPNAAYNRAQLYVAAARKGIGSWGPRSEFDRAFSVRMLQMAMREYEEALEMHRDNAKAAAERVERQKTFVGIVRHTDTRIDNYSTNEKKLSDKARRAASKLATCYNIIWRLGERDRSRLVSDWELGLLGA